MQPLIGIARNIVLNISVSSLLGRCHSRQFQIPLWSQKTVHCRRRSPLRNVPPSPRFHSKFCVHSYNMGISCCISYPFRSPTRSLNPFLFQNDLLTIWLAVLSIYCIDFSINAGGSYILSALIGTLTVLPVMAVDRALLVDTLPRDEQAKGNAWAAIMVGIGGVSGFFL